MQLKPKQKIRQKILSIIVLGFFMMTAANVFAQEGTTEENPPLYEPIEKQIVQLTDEGSQEGWNISKLETIGIKFLIRGKEALTWSLNIEDGGFHSSAIERSYLKVLTIVNSLFILGLLAIALMWMFSILIPRKYLKKVILVYCLAVIFVNFALPINQLFIDGTNLLQKTLLVNDDGKVQITDIVQTPAYTEAISYQNETAEALLSEEEQMEVSINGEFSDVPIGKISIAGAVPETITLSTEPLSVSRKTNFNQYQEQIFFRFALIMLTGIAYFIIALIFLLRIVILWALLILSPALFLLAIFQSTRGWFYNWLSMYGKWLLIGPLAALGIAIMVNIWQFSGLPISMSEGYSPEIFTPLKESNIVFYLPGKDTANTLSNTNQMMEYLIFLLMLYLPIFLAFGLTRKKVLYQTVEATSKTLIKKSQSTQSQLIQKSDMTKEESVKETKGGFIESIKNLVSDKVGLLTEQAFPSNKLKVEPAKPYAVMETASNFLPESLKVMAIPKMLELLGRRNDSKKSHQKIVQKLAHISTITDHREQEKVAAVMHEIQQRADSADKDALTILHEVQTIKEINTQNIETSTNNSTNEQKSDTKNDQPFAQVNIHVNDKKQDKKKKVKDRSEEEKNGEKNVKEEKKEEQDKEKTSNPNEDHAN